MQSTEIDISDAGLKAPPIRRRAPRSGSIPNIVYFDHTAIMSGGEIALFNLILALDKTRFHPIVVLGQEGPLGDRLRDAGIEVHVLLLDKRVANTRKDSLGVKSTLKLITALQCTRYVFSLARLLRASSADLLHTNSLKADILGGVAARMARVPVIWHVRDRIADDYLPSVAARLFRASCRVVPDYIIANSRATMETLSTGLAVRSAVVHIGSTNQQLRVVHDGIREHALPPRAIPTQAPLIGLVGRLSSWKGQHVFIDAAAEVVKEYPNAKFQIIGSAMFGEEAYETQIRKQTQDLGLLTTVEFAGFCDNVVERISKLDVLVHASTTGEPFGQVVVEGMVAGKPVIATAGGGILEIVQDGVTGLLVPMNDSHAMAVAVKKLLADPVTAQTMGLKGRARVLQNFTIERTATKVEEIYAEFLAETASE